VNTGPPVPSDGLEDTKMKKLLAIVGLGIFSMSAVAFAEGDAKIARTYASKCGSCHGEDGKGETKKGKEMGVKSMATAEWQKTTDEKIKKAIVDGATGKGPDGKETKMEAYGTKLKPEQIDALVGYVRTFAPK
jgi:mono/diheme cytochrome c family protein